jgi:hypothetical protein
MNKDPWHGPLDGEIEIEVPASEAPLLVDSVYVKLKAGGCTICGQDHDPGQSLCSSCIAKGLRAEVETMTKCLRCGEAKEHEIHAPPGFLKGSHVFASLPPLDIPEAERLIREAKEGCDADDFLAPHLETAIAEIKDLRAKAVEFCQMMPVWLAHARQLAEALLILNDFYAYAQALPVIKASGFELEPKMLAKVDAAAAEAKKIMGRE